MSHQDWKPVIINGGNVKAPKYKNKIVTYKNKGQETSSKNKKLDEATSGGKIEKIPKKIAQQLIAGRNAKKWKQKELAAKMSLPVKIIQDVESCKAKYNKQLIQKMARKLGIKIEKNSTNEKNKNKK